MSIERVTCIRCGHCCSNKCNYIRRNNDRATCVVHEQEEKMGAFCWFSPVQLYRRGVACRAIYKYLKENGYPRLRWETREYNGQVSIIKEFNGLKRKRG